MSLPQSQARYTIEKYLALERASEKRHEYLDGLIYAMSGESPEHGAICINISGQLYLQLRGRPCQAFSKDMKVRSGPEPESRRSPKGLFSYPDLLVVCGEMKFHDTCRDVLLNPTVIIEVLSPATEAFDRGEKWLQYQTWLPSLTDYLLVSQTKPVIDWYQRQPNGGWFYSVVEGLEKSIHLTAVGCTLRLADIYDRIAFPADPPAGVDEE